MHGFETVAHIRQRASDDDRHGIVDITRLHFADKLGLRNSLLREHNVLGLIISIVCHLVSSP